MPYFMHGYFWVIYRADSMFYLFLYNVTLLFAGLVGTIVHTKSRGSRVSWKLPTIVITEVSINTYNYCWDFRGKECPSTDAFTTNRKLGLIVMISLAASLLTGLAVAIGYSRRPKLVKKFIRQQKLRIDKEE